MIYLLLLLAFFDRSLSLSLFISLVVILSWRMKASHALAFSFFMGLAHDVLWVYTFGWTSLSFILLGLITLLIRNWLEREMLWPVVFLASMSQLLYSYYLDQQILVAVVSQILVILLLWWLTKNRQQDGVYLRR